MRLSDLPAIARESVPGFLVALCIGAGARLIAREVPTADALVVAVVLGMLLRKAIGGRMELFFRLLPGLSTAETTLLPLGVALYGRFFDIAAIVRTHPLVLAQASLLMVVTFVAMVGIGRMKWFGLPDRVLYSLGFGSAVCGASAIAITAPSTECEPDETSMALVDNTIAVVLASAFLGHVMRPGLAPDVFAALAGETLHQTSFVRQALVGLAAGVVSFGMAVKTFRIALLLVAIPLVTWRLKGRVRFPWYMLLLLVVAVLFWLAPMPGWVTSSVTEVQGITLSAALAAVGLRADLRTVFARLPKPLLLVLAVFAIDVGVFMVTRGLAVVR